MMIYSVILDLNNLWWKIKIFFISKEKKMKKTIQFNIYIRFQANGMSHMRFLYYTNSPNINSNKNKVNKSLPCTYMLAYVQYIYLIQLFWYPNCSLFMHDKNDYTPILRGVKIFWAHFHFTNCYIGLFMIILKAGYGCSHIFIFMFTLYHLRVM